MIAPPASNDKRHSSVAILQDDWFANIFANVGTNKHPADWDESTRIAVAIALESQQAGILHSIDTILGYQGNSLREASRPGIRMIRHRLDRETEQVLRDLRNAAALIGAAIEVIDGEGTRRRAALRGTG